MHIPTDEELRDLLDEDGLLRRAALEPPARAEAYTVFVQRPDARIDVEGLRAHGERFFRTRLGLTVDKRYVGHRPAPLVDAARVVVAPEGGAAATRLCYGRPRTDDDLAAAEAADARAGSPGLGLLARRCATVWLVALEAREDRPALLLAAILASTMLGPILSPGDAELFGVKTARGKLDEPG